MVTDVGTVISARAHPNGMDQQEQRTPSGNRPKGRNLPPGWYTYGFSTDPSPDHLHPRPVPSPVHVGLYVSYGLVTAVNIPVPGDLLAPPATGVLLIADGSDGWRPAGPAPVDDVRRGMGVGYRVAPRREWFARHPDGRMRP